MTNPQKNQKMFDEIAPKYDFMNNIISFGLHKIIKKLAINKLELKNGTKALDLCCGTGDITKLLSDRKEIEKVIGVDYSKKMLAIAKGKIFSLKTEFIEADCLKLPFEDNSFDLITMCFGLRNIEDKNSALSEIKRVLKNDGQFLHMDFGKGNFLTNFVFDKITPVFAKIFYKSSEPYKYLVKSKKEFLKSPEFKNLMSDNGFIRHKEYNFLFSSINVLMYIKSN